MSCRHKSWGRTPSGTRFSLRGLHLGCLVILFARHLGAVDCF